MSATQKIIATTIHAGIQATHLAETLNEHAAAGWHVQLIPTVVTRKGGAIYALKDAYYADTYYLVLEKSNTPVTYRCLLQPRARNTDDDLAALNTLLETQSHDGYHLAHLLTATSISPNMERPTPGTIGHVLLFEKEG